MSLSGKRIRIFGLECNLNAWPIAIVGEDPDGRARPLAVDSSGNLISSESEGAEVVSSPAYEASRVLKASPGTLISLSGYNSKASAQFIQLHDSATVPPEAVSGVAEVFTVDFGILTGADVKGKYITAEDADGPVYFWGDDGIEPDPEPGGRGIPFTITGDADNAGTLAAALETAAHADASFTASAALAVTTITNAATGARTDAADGDSGATVAVTQQGVTAIPAAVPLAVFTVPASSNFSFAVPVTGMPFTTGIAVCNSSTGPTKTVGGADCFFSAVIK